MSAQNKETGFKFPKHNSKMSFYNQDGDEVGVLDFTGHFNTVLDRNPGGKGRIRHFEPNFMWHVSKYPLLDTSVEILRFFKSFQYVTLCTPISAIQITTFVYYCIPLLGCVNLKPKSVQ